MKRGNMSRDSFSLNDKVRSQDQHTKKWSQVGIIASKRHSGNGQPVSYLMNLESGGSTIHHKSHIHHFISLSDWASERRVMFDSATGFSDGSRGTLRDRGEVGHTRMSKLRLSEERQIDGWPTLPPVQASWVTPGSGEISDHSVWVAHGAANFQSFVLEKKQSLSHS